MRRIEALFSGGGADACKVLARGKYCFAISARPYALFEVHVTHAQTRARARYDSCYACRDKQLIDSATT